MADVDVEFVEEMKTVPGGDCETRISAPYHGIVSEAVDAWEQRGIWSTDVKNMVERVVTVQRLADISRYAVQQTAQTQLQQGWTDSISLHPVSCLFHQVFVLSQAKDQLFHLLFVSLKR